MTAIEWTDKTWNPIVGCSIVSPGCTNCYAMKMAARIERMGTAPHYNGTTKDSKAGAVWTGKIAMAPQNILLKPFGWREPSMVFVNSMGDLFHADVPDDDIDLVFAIMGITPQHIYQVLTKRGDRMQAYMQHPDRKRKIAARVMCLSEALAAEAGTHKARIKLDHFSACFAGSGPLRNVWLGVSAEDQQRADERIPLLLQTPAAVRFVSAEPLLGPLDLLRMGGPGRSHDWLTGELEDARQKTTTPHLDWVIVGGESGKGARPMHPDWATSLRDQCAAAGVPFFFKQWGNWAAVSQMDLDAIYDKLYHPAPARDPEATRRSKVATAVLHEDGSRHDVVSFGAFLASAHAMTVFDVGKKAAGRLLDGQEHNGFPCEERA